MMWVLVCFGVPDVHCEDFFGGFVYFEWGFMKHVHGSSLGLQPLMPHGLESELCQPSWSASGGLPAGRLQGEGETLLVVEDDPAVRMIVLDELNELGYFTLEASDGLTAVPMLQSSRRIDLLISDIGLPGMSGWQIAEIARQCRPALPVLFMTGHAQSTAMYPAGIAPGMGMISKPFSMDEMAAKIRDMLSRQGPTGTDPAA